jgi:hypothetical protein
VAHRPFALPAGGPGEAPPGWAESALGALGGCGVDVVLTGRLQAGEVDAPGHTLSRRVLALHAGSAISPRRGERGSYDLVRARGAHLEVERRAFTGVRFEGVGASHFTRAAAGWVPLAPLEAPAAADDSRGA